MTTAATAADKESPCFGFVAKAMQWPHDHQFDWLTNSVWVGHSRVRTIIRAQNQRIINSKEFHCCAGRAAPQQHCCVSPSNATVAVPSHARRCLQQQKN
jgi:hypothetical protein